MIVLLRAGVRKRNGIVVGLLIGLFFVTLFSCGDQGDPHQNAWEWPSAPPDSLGLDAQKLDSLTARLQTGEFGLVSSLLIIRHGFLVYEQYFAATDAENRADIPEPGPMITERSANDLHDLYGATGNFSSVLIGIAIDEGYIGSVETRLLDFFPQYSDLDNMTPAKDSITLAHVLQMRAGFAWDEQSIPYSDPQNPVTLMLASDDVFKYVLDRPLSSSPGTEFVYNTGCAMLFSRIIEQATERPLEEYAREKLFNPLGIAYYEWMPDRQGNTSSGSNLRLRPRDMAKLGYLYLNDGVWQGQPLLSSSWVHESTTPYSTFESGVGFGYHWWLYPQIINGEETLTPYASGWGHQYIFIIRPLDMIVVSTAEHFRGEQTQMAAILSDYIIAAADTTAARP
ncbi:serine hydrolase domain-containing protein [Candidatus Zixiibacteriota bacterium]